MNAPGDTRSTRDESRAMDDREYPRDAHQLGTDALIAMLPARGEVALERRFQSLPALERRIAVEATLPVAALIFHCSRCGSTLLCRLLELDPANRVFAEPDALPKFLAMREDALLRGEGIAGLRTFIRAFGLAPHPAERRLIVKLTSRAIAYLPAFRAAFPGVPFVYLLRDPEDVVASLAANPPPFLHASFRAGVAASFQTSAPADHGDPASWLAWYVNENLRRALQHVAEFSAVVDYAQGVPAFVDLAARFCSRALSPASAEVTRVLAHHSKNPFVAFGGPSPAPGAGDTHAIARGIAGEAYALWRQKIESRGG